MTVRYDYGVVTQRVPRRDAVANRERVVAGALRAIARDGSNVPVLSIAEEAGVGVATFYRSFADRRALMRELCHRGYDRLLGIIDGIEGDGVESLDAVGRFLRETLAVADELVLPLHGSVPLMDDDALRKRDLIDAGVGRFLAQGRARGEIRGDVNTTDVVICSALITQPLSVGSLWGRVAERHIGLFLAGLAVEARLPGPGVGRVDIEVAFQDLAERDQRT